jgi:hypothetical protein
MKDHHRVSPYFIFCGAYQSPCEMRRQWMIGGLAMRVPEGKGAESPGIAGGVAFSSSGFAPDALTEGRYDFGRLFVSGGL